jgi:RNA polymerase sigma-70 factor (ECF subfamily)
VDPSLSDAVERSLPPDAAAFGPVVAANGAPLTRFVTSLLGGDEHAAHDVVQETFLAAWRALPRLERQGHLRPWLFQVAYNHAVSWLRRRGPRGEPFRGLEAEVAGSDPPPPPTVRIHGRATPSDEAAPLLRSALASLPPLYAAPLTLCYLEGMGARGTAEALGLGLSTVKMRLHRGRAMLLERLVARTEPRPRRRGDPGSGPGHAVPAPDRARAAEPDALAARGAGRAAS